MPALPKLAHWPRAPTREGAGGMTKAKKSWRDVLKIHPAADVFPLMSPEELQDLAKDIRKNGLRNPVSILCSDDDYLIDGRNRLDAMELAGMIKVDESDEIQPDLYFDYCCCREGGPSVAAMVIGANIKRRHLTPIQRAKLAAAALQADKEFQEKRRIVGNNPDKEPRRHIATGNTPSGRPKSEVTKIAESADVDPKTARKALQQQQDVYQPPPKPKPKEVKPAPAEVIDTPAVTVVDTPDDCCQALGCSNPVFKIVHVCALHTTFADDAWGEFEKHVLAAVTSSKAVLWRKLIVEIVKRLSDDVPRISPPPTKGELRELMTTIQEIDAVIRWDRAKQQEDKKKLKADPSTKEKETPAEPGSTAIIEKETVS